jgi:hypothetical protein
VILAPPPPPPCIPWCSCLVHAGQSLPPARALRPLQKIDALLVAVLASLVVSSVDELSLSQQLRVGLPFRHSGPILGGGWAGACAVLVSGGGGRREDQGDGDELDAGWYPGAPHPTAYPGEVP